MRLRIEHSCDTESARCFLQCKAHFWSQGLQWTLYFFLDNYTNRKQKIYFFCRIRSLTMLSYWLSIVYCTLNDIIFRIFCVFSWDLFLLTQSDNSFICSRIFTYLEWGRDLLLSCFLYEFEFEVSKSQQHGKTFFCVLKISCWVWHLFNWPR